MVVFFLGPLADAAYRIDTVEESGKLDRSAQGAVGALPAGEVGQCRVYLVVR
jgi:hypothetical protein